MFRYTEIYLSDYRWGSFKSICQHPYVSPYDSRTPDDDAGLGTMVIPPTPHVLQ
jgi:hypothetical protein